jgi:hypothetical protein
MLSGRFAGWLSAARSYRVGLTASRRCGRSIKLRRAGRLREALEAARSGLALLDAPGVQRHQPAEGSVLVTLTIQAEQLAEQLGETGASKRDLADTAEYLRSMPPATKGQAGEIRRDWLPYFEARLAHMGSRGSENKSEAAEQ